METMAIDLAKENQELKEEIAALRRQVTIQQKMIEKRDYWVEIKDEALKMRRQEIRQLKRELRKDKEANKGLSAQNFRRLCQKKEDLKEKVAQLEKKNKALKEKLKASEEEIKALNRKLSQKEEQIKDLEEAGKLKEDFKKLQELIVAQELTEKNKTLKEELAKAQAKLNQNSDNSSVSTGDDPNRPNSEKKPKSANRYNSRQKSGRKPGGQAGHKGCSLSKKDLEILLEDENTIFERVDIGEVEEEVSAVSYMIDLLVVPKVTQRCYHKKEHPQQQKVSSFIHYGPTIRALGVLLNTELSVSYHKCSQFIKTLSHGKISPSVSTVYNGCKEFAKKSKKETARLAVELLGEPVLQTDSTVMIVGGKRNNLRVFTAGGKTLFCATKTKTIKEMADKTILSLYNGILVHDHEVALYHFGGGHSECLVHLNRYLQKIYDETGNPWTLGLQAFFSYLMKKRRQMLEAGENAFSEEQISHYRKTYERLLERGLKQNKTTEFEFARKDEATLIKRLQDYEDEHLLFLTDFKIPPDNNASEEKFRQAKIKQKMTTGFRTFEGLEDYGASLTVLRNLKDSNDDILDSLANFF